MARNKSLVGRVAQGSALAASASAFLAALVTITLAHHLVTQAEDRRLLDAAVTFAAELDHDGLDLPTIQKTHLDESAELRHTGMLLIVYDAQARLLAGDARVPRHIYLGCATSNPTNLRVCQVRSARGLWILAGAAHTTMMPLLALAAILSALLAAIIAWIVSRPMSRYAVAPLTKLRQRIAALDVVTLSLSHLGPPSGVLEVDELRATLGQLLLRIEGALGLANRFAANAAHELKTPLTSNRAELELLAENLHDSNQKEDASRAVQKLTELTTLVQRLLILSVPQRSDADAHELVSLRDLLEDALATLDPADRQRIFLDDDDATVQGDAALLDTMLVNALANGLKFGHRVSTRLTLAGSEVLVHIDDDGPGLAPTDRERVFEPFFRTDDAIRRRLPGHGLGLALIRHIAQTHGGSASFVDKPDRGARLEIRLPIAPRG